MTNDQSLIPIKGISFILSVKIFIAPQSVPEFLAHFKAAYDAVLAEPECLFFTVGTSPSEPGVVSWTEGWVKDVDWFMNVQIKKEYYQPYFEATERLFLKPRTSAFPTPAWVDSCWSLQQR